MPRWNEEQALAIAARQGNCLVAAGAGSGKTAVLTERIAQLVLEGVPLRSMLVVTFTNAAAAEMRKRVQSRLIELSGDGNLPEAARINAQAGEQSLDSACISTLHAFCGQVLRRHFHAVGLDPAFRTADDFEAGTLRHKAVEQVLDAAYEQGGEDFAALLLSLILI